MEEMNYIIGLSVTEMVKQVKQPRGGFVNKKAFNELKFDDGEAFKTGSV